MDSDKENENDVFSISEDFVQSPTHRSAGISELTFGGLLSRPLKLHEDVKEGCGGRLWPAGMVLAKYMLRQQRDELKGQSILDLGAGGGLVGLAVTLGCHDFQAPVWLTDQLPMLALMQRNISLNGLDDIAKATVYDWGTSVPVKVPQHPDVILAADCVYFEPAFPLLQKTLCDLIGDNTTCYFCFKRRRRADMQFVKTLKKLFDVTDVDDDPDRATYNRQNIHLVKITRKATR